jgi:LacI family transcriptional regulator
MVTLKDISKATGYSLASVHRAIYNKDGLGEEKRKKILETVKAMGYEVNYTASSLKRKTLQIVFVGRKPKKENDYHYMLASGARDAFLQDEGLNIHLRELYFDDTKMNYEDAECQVLDDVYRANDVDGVVIMPVNTSMRLCFAAQKIISKGCPVVFVDDSFENMDYLCSVEPISDLVGRTGAEFMSLACRPGKILIALGDSNSKGQMDNYLGFLQYMKENGGLFTCVPVAPPQDGEDFIQKMVREIDDEVVGLFAVCESNTPVICKAAIASGRKDLRLLGCDLSLDNQQYLLKGILTGVLDMDSYMQGYLAMKMLLDYLLKNKKPHSSILSVPVRLVLKSNLPYYKGFRNAGYSIATR